MLPVAVLLIAGLVWLGLLFAVAVLGERSPHRLRALWPAIYALSLAVYCTAWTFYGTVTQAVRSDWPIPPTFVGTIALFVFGWRFLERLVRLSKEANSTSLADFIASRLGKSSTLAAVVTGVAVLGMVPYIALQLKAVALSASVLSQGVVSETLPAWQDTAFWVAMLMAVFAMLFGTRRAAATEHNRGLVLAMAFESLLKLGAMLALGLFVVFGLFDGPVDLLSQRSQARQMTDVPAFMTLALLGVLAMFTLPHQFHIGVVECGGPKHIAWARWLFPLFLILISAPIFVLAEAGTLRLGEHGIPSDLYVLALPLGEGHQALALLTFLGGLSAATGMVVLASLTLSIMIGNHWLTPWLVAQPWQDDGGLRIPVLLQRRLGIVLVLVLAWAYSRALGASEALADIGALSFSGLAQLAPAVLVAVYWPRTRATAVLVGLASGTLVWSYVLIIPLLGGGDWAAIGLGSAEVAALSWLQPHNLFALGGLDALSRGVLSSLVVNVTAMLAWQTLTAPPGRQSADVVLLSAQLSRDIARRFLSVDRCQTLFAAELPPAQREARLEHELAAVVGAASARLLLDAARRRTPAPLETVADIVGQASEQARFNQSVLEGALENMSQGICVVDAALRLVAWNRRYLELFDYPDDLVEIGRPVRDLISHNVRRGLLGEGDNQQAVERRLAHMRAGTRHLSERLWPDGSVIEIRGNPLPDGGFVATFTDVTAFRRAEAQLKTANETLEQRVRVRTAELQLAREQAESANAAKSRFLAAVSHDLVQPLNAAHLFTHALAQTLRHPEYRDNVRQIDSALEATETLLAGLLDISRLDAGGLPVRRRSVALQGILEPLATEFQAMAVEAGLRLRYVPCRCWVDTDPQLLRRVVQNFLSNALRYTERGSVLLGCRRRGSHISIEVWDTGTGIAAADQALVFEEFRRLHKGGAGLGLGLAIAERMARLLAHPLQLRSQPGRGTVFSVRVPRVAAVPRRAAAVPRFSYPALLHLRVLVVDNEAAVLDGMQALLQGWGCTVQAATSIVAALELVEQQTPDAALLDFHLDAGENGLQLAELLRRKLPSLAIILVTADHSEEVRAKAQEVSLQLIHKPLKPLKLRSLLTRLRPSTPSASEAKVKIPLGPTQE